MFNNKLLITFLTVFSTISFPAEVFGFGNPDKEHPRSESRWSGILQRRINLRYATMRGKKTTN